MIAGGTLGRHDTGAYRLKSHAIGPAAAGEKPPFLGSYIYVLSLTSGRAFWFDFNGKLMVVFEADGLAYDYIAYDANGRLIRVYMDNDSDRKIELAYDLLGRMTSATDFTGRAVQFT